MSKPILSAPTEVFYSVEEATNLVSSYLKNDPRELCIFLESKLHIPVYMSGNSLVTIPHLSLLQARRFIAEKFDYESPFKDQREHDEACLEIVIYMYEHNELPEDGFRGKIRQTVEGSPRDMMGTLLQNYGKDVLAGNPIPF